LPRDWLDPLLGEEMEELKLGLPTAFTNLAGRNKTYHQDNII
jgi:hypothetical protein